MRLLQFLFKVIYGLTDASDRTENACNLCYPFLTFSLVYLPIVAVLYLVTIELQELQKYDIKFERNIRNARKKH